MLQPNTLYETHVISPLSHSDKDVRLFHVIERLDEGELAVVFKVEPLEDAGHVLVAKVPKVQASLFGDERDKGDKGDKEFEILEKLNAYFRGSSNGETLIPVPRDPELRRFKGIQNSDFSVDALLMEYIPPKMKPMRDVIWEKFSAATPSNTDERMHAETFAWFCARRYLDVVDAGIQHAGIYTTDRKSDTFRWDDENRRLIVLDWNQYVLVGARESDRDEAEKSSLVNMGQFWYTLLTERSATLTLPAWSADEKWNGISLFGRTLLRRLVEKPSNISQIQQELDEFLDVVSDADDIARERKLRQRFDSESDGWNMADPTKRSSGAAEFLVWADLAARIGNGSLREQAAGAYADRRTDLLRTGDDVDFTRPVKALLAEFGEKLARAGQPFRAHDALLRELLAFLDQHADIDRRVNLRQYVERLQGLFSTRADDMPSAAQTIGEQLKTEYDQLIRQYQRATGQIDVRLLEISQLIELLQLFGSLHRSLSQGDGHAAMRNIADILPMMNQAPDRETFLGVTAIALKTLYDDIRRVIDIKSIEKHALESWFKDLVAAYEACIDADNPEKLYEYKNRVMLALAAPRTERELLQTLITCGEISTTLCRVFEFYLDNTQRWKALTELVPIFSRFPDTFQHQVPKTSFGKALLRDMSQEHAERNKHGKHNAVPPLFLQKLKLLRHLLPRQELFAQREGNTRDQ